MRDAILEALTQSWQAGLIESARAGKLTVRDRVTRLPCAVKAPEEALLVSDADLNKFLADSGLLETMETEAGELFALHARANAIYLDALASSGKKLNKSEVARKLERHGVKGERAENLDFDTIRKRLAAWKAPSS